MKVIIAACKNTELHLGGDETFFGKTTLLVLMELTSGFILTEAKADDSTFKTWERARNNSYNFIFTDSTGDIV